LKGVEQNPRQTKRFINNFIVALSANSLLKKKATEFLLSEVLTKRWPTFYQDMNSNEIFREYVKEYVNLSPDVRAEKLRQTQKEKEKLSPELKKLVEIDPELWNFLVDYGESLSKVVEDWDIYRAAGASANIPYDVKPELQSRTDMFFEAYRSLLKGEISVREFWSQTGKGNLRDILYTIIDSADAYALSNSQVERAKRLLSIIPDRIKEWENAQVHGDSDSAQEIEHLLRQTYDEANNLLISLPYVSSGESTRTKKIER
jgi:hypothetical protein